MKPKPAKTPRASAVKKVLDKHKAVLRCGGTDFFSADSIVLLTPTQRHYGNENAYYVLPATPEAYDAQVEAMAKADWYCDGEGNGWHWKHAGTAQTPYRKSARIALAAIGIRQPRPARSRK